MTLQPADIREQLTAAGSTIRTSHRHGADGWQTCLALTRAMDDAVRSAFNAGVPEELQSQCAVLAVGGYGRAELCPFSDVDVLVVCADGALHEQIQSAAKRFLHLLWDTGIDVGHSVRTVEEALSLHGHSLDAWTAMVESRYLCGATELADALTASIRERIARGPDSWFIRGVFADMSTRHERFGTSVKLLEPNVKKSAGGLRDLHMLFWLHRAVDPAYFFPLSGVQAATVSFLHLLHQNKELDAEEVGMVRDALGFLLRVRHEMHYQRSAMNDTLEYALQRDVAAALGFGDRDELRSVEVFMAAYYRQARRVHSLHRRLSQRFQEVIEPAPHSSPARVGDDGLLRVDDRSVSVAPGMRTFASPREVFRAAVLAAEQGLELDFRVRAAIERSLPAFTDQDRLDPELAVLFGRIIRSGRAGKSFHGLNDLGVLGWYIPEFGDLVAFFQHNVYHYFTADEHTLIAIAHAEDLVADPGPLGEVYRSLPEREVLLLAILVHDIAKPLGVADHEITGVTIAHRVLDRVGLGRHAEAVGFLVRHHLIMEQTAFRRNVHDPATIRDFASRFERPGLLEYLYLLTYADLSALNITVWTEWKAAMLHDLYRRTAEVLHRNLHGEEIDRFHEDRHAEVVAELGEALAREIPRDEISGHLRAMDNDAYQAVFTPAEIAGHIRAARNVDTPSTLFSHYGSHTEVTIIARDAPFALSRFCAVLAANDANIFDANIFTRNDGVIIDRFRVSSAMTSLQLDTPACEKISREIGLLMVGDLDVAQLFREHHRKWKRRPRSATNPNIRTDVEFEETAGYTIIDVYAPDSVGFLYRVTETISQLGLDIYFAKIATRVDGIIDAFYVRERDGGRITSGMRHAAIRKEILAAIRRMTELAPA